MASLKSLRKDDLKTLAEERGLSAEGTRAQLVARLEQSGAPDTAPESDAAPAATKPAPKGKGCYIFWLRNGQGQCRPMVADPADGRRKRIQLMPGYEYPLPLTPVDFRKYTSEPESIYPGVAWRYDKTAAAISLEEIAEATVAIHRASIRSPILSKIKARLSKELGAEAMLTLVRQGGEPALEKHYNAIVDKDEALKIPGLNPVLPAGVVKLDGDRAELEHHLCPACGIQTQGIEALRRHNRQQHGPRSHSKAVVQRRAEEHERYLERMEEEAPL